MPEEPRRRARLRRSSDQDENYLRDKIDDVLTSLNVTIDTVGQLATKLGQMYLDSEDREKRIRWLEKMQWRNTGMFAVIVFEIPLLIGTIYFLLKGP